MRSLVILRGACGSGKSTWIKNMNLENYTLCADTIRLLVESPILTADESKVTISQQNDNYVSYDDAVNLHSYGVYCLNY